MREEFREMSTALDMTPSLGADIVKASWRRCLTDYGLDRAMRKPIERVGSATVRDLRSQMEDVLVESSSVIERVRRIAADTGNVVLVSNSDGIVVTSFADSNDSQEVAREGLDPGSVWQEGRVGTNGIGTCLISRQPITIHGGAHFNESFRHFTCSAAPIFGPDGRVIAAFDMSGRAIPGSSDGSFAQYFVREAASQISMMLFRKWHRNDCIVALANEPDPMPMSVKALVATDEEGRILGATQEALSFLGVPDLGDLGGKLINDLWNVSFGDLKPLSKHSVRMNNRDGSNTFVTAFLPKKKATSTPGRTTQALDGKRARLNPATQTRPLDRVAGADPLMIQNIGLCRKIIDKDIPLLVLGETGVGKDTLARALHNESKRAEKPYVAVNCAAIPATLLASELFGYAPGTFTGGVKGGRTGKILASHGGTLFLDEIGDMPLELQAHLLRVLEERTVTPLGSADAIPVDMKIICATHRNLPDLIAKGHFRKDLYYRIRGAQIVLPALRDRADIAELIGRIVREEDGTGTPPIEFSEGVMDLFRTYPWPGNIRELRNVIRFVTSLHAGKLILVEDLPDQLLDYSKAGTPPATVEGPVTVDREAECRSETPAGTTLLEANETAERRRIVEVLRANKWNVTEAAGHLGISRATLHRKIRRYAIMSPNNQN
jgi:sigma-54 dependent transcriptional regulator, acetoin dehydrogenase operon transcriptional activator AcoR